MKLLSFIICLFLLSTQVMAQSETVWGGTLKSKKQAIRLVCSVKKDMDCLEFSVETAHVNKYNSILEFSELIKIEAPDNNKWAESGNSESRRAINNGYALAGGVGTFTGAVSCMFAWWSCPYDLVSGIMFDLYKAPIVGASYVLHRVLVLPRKSKLVRNIRFLTDPINSGATKKTSKAQVKYLIRGLN